MAEAGPRYQESRDIWNDYNATQKFEHELIHRKTTWWLATQTILFNAYGVSLGNGKFGRVVAGVGLAVAALTLIGVWTVIRSKRLSLETVQRRLR